MTLCEVVLSRLPRLASHTLPSRHAITGHALARILEELIGHVREEHT